MQVRCRTEQNMCVSSPGAATDCTSSVSDIEGCAENAHVGYFSALAVCGVVLAKDWYQEAGYVKEVARLTRNRLVRYVREWF